MKLHPKQKILFALSAIILLISCHKNVSPPATQTVRIKSSIVLGDSTWYIYDAKWRLIEKYIQSNGTSSTKKYYYTDTTVTVNNFDSKINFLGVTIYHLNARGLAISMTDTASANYHTYTYNSDNQLTRVQIRHTQGGIDYNSDDQYYYNHDGDLDSNTVLSISNGTHSVTYYPQYDLTKTNTLDNQYLGQSFLGSSSHHPAQKTTAGDGTTLFTFSYSYDQQGRIATQEWEIGGATFLSNSFTYY